MIEISNMGASVVDALYVSHCITGVNGLIDATVRRCNTVAWQAHPSRRFASRLS